MAKLPAGTARDMRISRASDDLSTGGALTVSCVQLHFPRNIPGMLFVEQSQRPSQTGHGCPRALASMAAL
ncbi:uncharacterized protein K444DRAFT_617611 [Hyaloscypha bicolor E]|uniref:Uncharacterized protein n=1 Tax=Hyaloscypha bicolor E TaxID=1095630 RepID=A0A2J6SWI7_9HELO|nr:uncharacterized protein K444DRAFT_617611 [Hyaloscypha bicolor E]PMD55150.1 hypothetical protein K444DRAFT_617611 [Hyaloscypha bicolor E]